MRSFFPLTVYCISLVSLQQLLLALPAEERPDSNRLDLLNQLFDEVQDKASPSEDATPKEVPSLDRRDAPKWLPGFLAQKPASGARLAPSNLAWARPAESSRVRRSALRARRHTGSRNSHHHPQLMRVGCNLGTCQVQNLSHRLYQLIGQSGREDSSPINPKSPHSYG